MSAASQMLGADGLAIDGAVREGELVVLHVEERVWIERGRFAPVRGAVVANRRLRPAASFSCARRCCSGSMALRPGTG
jgi:hypothetical protein